MKNLVYLALILGGLVTMRTMTHSKLPQENGNVNARTLPLDREKSTVRFETATFGLG